MEISNTCQYYATHAKVYALTTMVYGALNVIVANLMK